MKKDAIIDILSNDLKEMQLLLDNFRGDDAIPSAFIELLKAKHSNIGKEVELLVYWQTDDNTPSAGQQPQVADVLVPNNAPIVEQQPKVDVPIVSPKIVVQPESEPQPEPMPEPKSEPVLVPRATPTPAPQQPQKASPKATDVATYGTPVSDIKKAIAIADRFLYQKELFGGDATDFNAAIEIANSMESYEEAERYLVATYGWDADDPTVVSFLKAVHRRFI